MTTSGSTFAGTVQDLVSDGRGVVTHPDGRACFVGGVWPGEKGVFRVSGLRGRIGFAELIELREASPYRIKPPCRYHGFGSSACGGCPWQFMAYPQQLLAKQARIESSLQRIGVAAPVGTIEPSPQVWGYRNRAQFKTDGTRLGFVARESNALVPVEHCLALSAQNNETLAQLVAQLPCRAWRPSSRGRWTTLDIDETTPASAVSVNRRLPFAQANSAQNDYMRRWLQQKLAPLNRDSEVIELFCGSGNFTQVIAAAGFRRILAVEGAAEALESLRARALPGVECLQQNLFGEAAWGTVFRRAPAADILVLDPPREGLKNTKGLFGPHNTIGEVFYISCDLATLSRDLQAFIAAGYRVAEVQPLDQLPHTPHIECLVHLQRSARPLSARESARAPGLRSARHRARPAR